MKDKTGRIDISVEKIVKLYLAGEGSPSIARILGVCDSTIRNRLREAGIPIRPGGCNGWSEEEEMELRDAYSRPQPDLRALSNKFCRSKANICRKAKQLGLGTSYHRPKSYEAKLKMRLSKGGISTQEEMWLKENFNKYTNREIAELLNREDWYIESQLERLNLRKDLKERGWKWRGGHPRGMNGKHHSEKMKKKASADSIAMWGDPSSKVNSEEHRQKLSDNMSRRQRAGTLATRYSRTKGGKRADLGGLYVRSGWEANYARYLNWMKARGEIREWIYESDTFDFPIKRGTRSYTPDFKIIENNGDVSFHEIKGWMTPKSKTALDRMARYHPEIKIVLIGEKEYTALKKWKSMIPNWEGK